MCPMVQSFSTRNSSAWGSASSSRQKSARTPKPICYPVMYINLCDAGIARMGEPCGVNCTGCGSRIFPVGRGRLSQVSEETLLKLNPVAFITPPIW